MKKHKITVRHVRESHPRISSTRTPADIARKLFFDADEWGYDEILSIEVDGETFYSAP